MAKTLQEKIFQNFALSIIGVWHNQTEDETISFSLLPDAVSSGDFTISKNGLEEKGSFSLGFYPDNEVFLTIKLHSNSYITTLKLLSTDTLLLTKKNQAVQVYKRMPDFAFANQVIECL